MKWEKQRYTPKANTHRAGWKFWDLIDDNNEALGWVRYRPDYGYDVSIPDLTEGAEWAYFRHAIFATEKEAKDAMVAYFVTKRLEDYT
jgi:hypothetical protein